MKGLGRTLVVFVVLAMLGIWLIPGVSDLPVTRIDAAELIGIGLIVGAYGTMVGVGGGFLIVPILLLWWNLPPAQAAGTSLVVVFLNATAGSISYARQGRIDFRSGLWFAAATLPGAVAGAFLAKFFSGTTFNLTFAILLLLVAGLLLWKPVRGADSATGARLPVNMPLGLIISFFVGFLSSALGIGGGIFHVPAMIYLLHFPAAIAAATSTFILAFSSLVGAGTHLSLGNVLFGPAALMGIGVLAGSRVGAELAKKAKGATTVRLLSVALIIVAIRLLMRG